MLSALQFPSDSLSWKQEILSRLDTLAVKAGALTSNVWSVFVAQQRVDAILALVFMSFLWLCCAALHIVARKSREKDGGWWHNEDAAFWLTIVSIIFTVITFIVTVGMISEVGKFINPQYYAIQDLIKMLRGAH